MAKDSLQRIAPDLSSRLRGQPDATLRRVAIAVSKLAARRAGLDLPVAMDAVHRLETDGSIPLGTRAELKRSAEELDELYLSLCEAADSSELSDETWRPTFHKAKAAMAIVLACEEDAFFAATEAVVEACDAMGGDLEALRKAVLAALAE